MIIRNSSWFYQNILYHRRLVDTYNQTVFLSAWSARSQRLSQRYLSISLHYRSTRLVENAIPWCTLLDYKGQRWGCGRTSRRSTLLSTANVEQTQVLVCAPSLSSHRLEPNLCGIGSRGCAFESGMRHIHIFFLYDRVFDRSWNRMPDVARKATLLQWHGYDLGHERGGRLYFGLRNQRRVHSRCGIMHEANSREYSKWKTDFSQNVFSEAEF